MEEQFALLAVADALKHAITLYDMLLYDKMIGEREYAEKTGYCDIILADRKLLERVKEIEDCEIPDNKEL